MISSIYTVFLTCAIPAVFTFKFHPWGTSQFLRGRITFTAANLTGPYPDTAALEMSVNRNDMRIVSLKQGLVAGVETLGSTNRTGQTKLPVKVWQFHDIPYAVAPVGKRRFMEPKRFKSWKGTWDATRDRGELVECVQFKHNWGGKNKVIGSEDCLYLSVFTPLIPRRDRNSSDLLPVIVYIHGGSFMYGSKTHFDPKEIVTNNNIVFVKFNYRLGPLGFLSTDDNLVPGNMGLRDQIMALEWVRDNIADFGGNPNSVTLAGSYAGGASVHFHMLSKKSAGLFHRAISISGTMLSPWALSENLLGKTRLLADYVGCPDRPNEDMIKCLRARPASYLVDAVQVTLPILYNPVSPWAPTVDSHTADPLLPEFPGIHMYEKNGTNVPWLVGISDAEGLYIGAEMVRNSFVVSTIDEQWSHLASFILDYDMTVEVTAKPEIAREIREEYMKIKRVGFKKEKDICENKFSCRGFCEMIGDRMFVVDAERSARWMSKSATAPVYFFIFNSDKNNDSATVKDEFLSGVEHLGDYFNLIKFSNRQSVPTSQEAKNIEFINDLWAHFAKHGEPNIPNWPVVKPDQFSYMEINGSTNHNPRLNVSELGRRKFWQHIAFLESNRYPSPFEYSLSMGTSARICSDHEFHMRISN